MIAVSSISKKYKHIVLENISFTINSGEICCVLGKTGAGKSTLLNIIAGETKPDSGGIILNNIPLRRNAIFQQYKIGLVSEKHKLISQFTGYQFLEFRCLIYKMPRHQITERIKTLTSYFFEDSNELNKFPVAYSVSAAIKLKIIAALIHNPDILLLDDPFAKINPAAAKKLAEMIKILSEKTTAQR